MGKKKLDQVAYEYLVKQIEEGNLLQREHIKEQDVADELQISRTPVRTALNRLVEDDYLEYIKKNGGVRVKTQRLDATSFQERMDVFERLINHYLFDLEKKEMTFDTTEMNTELNEFKQALTDDPWNFEKFEYQYWTKLLNYNENTYEKEILLKTVGECLFDEGYIHDILSKSENLKLKHLKELTQLLNANNYPAARREIRIMLNQLKLNIIEHGLKY